MSRYIHRSGNEFAAEVLEETIELVGYTTRVWKGSILRFVEFMQRPRSAGGNMPVRTGFLRASLLASTAPIEGGTQRHPGGESYAWNMRQVFGVVNRMRPGDQCYFAYEAEYADAVEYGFKNRPAAGFQRLAIQAWPSLVAAEIASAS
jgi:hypothetical protein